MNVEGIVTALAQDLNDAEKGYEHTTWSAEMLIRYVQEACAVISIYKAELFSHEVILKVSPGTNIQDCTSCGEVYKVLGVSTKDGRVLRGLRQIDLQAAQDWMGGQCSDAETLRSYAIDRAGGRIYLYPVTRPGIDTYVLLECGLNLNAIDVTTEIKSAAIPLIMQWALFRAHSMDAEVAPAAQASAAASFNTFVSLANLTKEEADKVRRRVGWK